jgi:hypothetical protein
MRKVIAIVRPVTYRNLLPNGETLVSKGTEIVKELRVSPEGLAILVDRCGEELQPQVNHKLLVERIHKVRAPRLKERDRA